MASSSWKFSIRGWRVDLVTQPAKNTGAVSICCRPGPKGGETMVDFRSMYIKLFDRVSQVIQILCDVQCECEEVYCQYEDGEEE